MKNVLKIQPRRDLMRRIAYGCAAFICVWVLVVMASSWNKSTVMDEVPHIGAGLSYWKFGDFRMNPEHPPLVKALSVLPAMVLNDIPVIYETSKFQVSSWYFSDHSLYGYFLLFRNKVNPRLVVFHSRLVPIAIGVIGGLLALWWGMRLGRSLLAGAVSGALLMLYPEYAGHSRFVTLDVPTLVGCAGISVVAYSWWRRPTYGRAAVFALVAAVGSLVKLPVTVYCVFMLMTLAMLWGISRRPGFYKGFAGLLVATVLLGYLAAWAAAGFRFGLTNPELPISKRSIYAPADGNYGAGALGRLLGLIWKYRLLPEATLATLAHVKSFELRNYYFMGKWEFQGWYSYFFATFLLKTSLVMVAVYIAAVVTWAWQLWRMKGKRRSAELARLAILVVPFASLFAVFVLGRASLGHRYILFVYFPLSVLTGVAMVRWWWRTRGGRVVSGLVLVYGLVVFAWQYPHYETYFNEVVRVPLNGLKYVADSNVDWGQDFPLLGMELQKRGIRQVNLAVFGSGRPSAYRIPEFKWILPKYPFATFHTSGESEPPDPNLYTAMSVHALPAALQVLPGHYERDPIWVENSVMLFAPEAIDGAAQ